MKKMIFSIIALALILSPLAATAGTETVRKDCAAMSSWYECRDIQDADQIVQDGYNFIHNTPVTLGPWGYVKGADGKPIVNGALSCDSCHFDGGQVPGGIPFFQVRDKYSTPVYWRAGNKERLVAERINWCLVSCANGQFLPEDSYEMQAMIAYMNWVADGIQDPSMVGGSNYKNIPGHDLPLVNPGALSMKADVAKGRSVYMNRCDECHGDRGPGRGRYDEGEPRARVPALWGSNVSFTKGAQGMYTAPLLATLIKRFMPLGEANLTDQQALDVAGYIDAQPHDMGYATEQFFGGIDPESGTIPNYLFKVSYWPIGVPTPNDPFTFEQRLLGPWQPIEDWQAEQRAAGDFPTVPEWHAEQPLQ